MLDHYINEGGMLNHYINEGSGVLFHYINRVRLADDKLWEISVCVSPMQAKKYAIKPVIPETYHQPDAPYILTRENIYRHWKKCGMEQKIGRNIARLIKSAANILQSCPMEKGRIRLKCLTTNSSATHLKGAMVCKLGILDTILTRIWCPVRIVVSKMEYYWLIYLI